MEDVIKIQTLEGKKPVYGVNKKTLGLLKKYMGGWFGHREEGGVIEVRPISTSAFNIMKNIPGINDDSFEFLRNE